ncbi:hypothetical protein EYC84_003231 [Monilinia fructicola]|uniref:Uncharacterized protein n=1 Tax=Monilinia fructicola TaxID=38448 RepID=A0A5M9JTV8_MONFR|nr:hypothetical protein EYC84_003231 [Monilinia fructicola]
MKGYSLYNVFTFPTPHDDRFSHDLRRISGVEEITVDPKARWQFRLLDRFMLGEISDEHPMKIGFSALISLGEMCIMHGWNQWHTYHH